MRLRVRIQVLGLLLLALFRRQDVGAACVKGSFVNGTWTPIGCSIPEPADAANQCLASRTLLFMGGSTTREIFKALCRHLKVEVHRHPCNLHMGWGCHDCLRGCHSSQYIGNSEAMDWHDAFATTASGTQITFTWKPEMLTVDDMLFLKQFIASTDTLLDAVIVHKGVHEAFILKNELKPINYSEDTFELELSTRAEVLAKTLREIFPNTMLIWRDAFYNGKDAELEDINSKLRPIIQERFRQEGFHVLPGHHISMTAYEFYNETDGVHQHESVNDVIVSMIADMLCFQGI